jgi:hypothetical protein
VVAEGGRDNPPHVNSTPMQMTGADQKHTHVSSLRYGFFFGPVARASGRILPHPPPD